MRKYALALSLLVSCSVFAVDDSPPQLYQPTYVYGDTPMGIYMGGDPYDGMGDEMMGGGMMGDDMMDDDMYMPEGEGMGEIQTQSGEQEQSFQFIQGQEELMADHSKQALKAYQQEQVIGESMEQQYLQQIDKQTHQLAQQPIVLPTM